MMLILRNVRNGSFVTGASPAKSIMPPKADLRVLEYDEIRMNRHCEERQRRSNPLCPRVEMDCFASLAMTIQTYYGVTGVVAARLLAVSETSGRRQAVFAAAFDLVAP
jgi:hypothetical protein